jgi:FkbM family methyltransferase
MAAAYLRAGDFANGLPWYEHRAEILPRTAPPPPGPTWKGEKTGHLCVWGDQGYGDRIQFARFLPWAKERCDKITFLTDPNTVTLLHGYKDHGVADVGCWYPPETKFDHVICLTSIPLVYGLTPDNIPPDPGWLIPSQKMGNLLQAPGFKIGVAWAGNKDHPNDYLRSLPFLELLALCADPRNDLFSLQCGPAAADIAKNQAQRIVADMSGHIAGEWAHTAALIEGLDLVVTVDTALAHIAGAMGKKTFLLLPRFSDWRWLWGVDFSPWYPSMTLFRQEKPGDWRGVMKRVVAAVTGLHRDRAMIRMLNQDIRTAGRVLKTMDPHAPGTADEKEPDVAAVLRKVLRPGDTFVDVGANVGMHTVLAAELVGEHGKVIAVEPGENALPELRKAVGGKPQVEIVARPLDAASGPVEFHLCADGSGGNALWDPGEFPSNDKTRANPRKVTLRATTLNSVCLGRNVRLIKIDTEGAEQHILEGGLEMLVSNPPPFIVTELHEFGLAKMGCSQESLRQFMEKVGYRMFALFADGSKPYLLKPEERIESRMIVNVLFSTEAEVEKLWPGEATDVVRPLFGYVAGEARDSAA